LESHGSAGSAADGVFFLGVRSTHIYCRQVVRTAAAAAQRGILQNTERSGAARFSSMLALANRMNFRRYGARTKAAALLAESDEGRFAWFDRRAAGTSTSRLRAAFVQ